MRELSSGAFRLTFTSENDDDDDAGMFGSAVFLVGLSFLGCSQKVLAVVLMALSTTFSGVRLLRGFFVSHIDVVLLTLAF